MDGNESDETIRALMCHTAGIIDGEESFYGLRREDSEIRLLDILDGKTTYNNRPARAEKTQGSVFEYSDAGYCVLQLLVQEITNKNFEDAVKEIIFDKLHLENTFFASSENLTYYENNKILDIVDVANTSSVSEPEGNTGDLSGGGGRHCSQLYHSAGIF